MVNVKLALPFIVALLPHACPMVLPARPVLTMVNTMKQTNADRLARGLGPLPPTRRSTGKLIPSYLRWPSTRPRCIIPH